MALSRILSVEAASVAGKWRGGFVSPPPFLYRARLRDGPVKPVGEELERNAERSALLAAVQALNPRERQIMELRFGLRDGVEHTQKEVADSIGISQSYISRLEKRIIKRLRQQIESLV